MKNSTRFRISMINRLFFLKKIFCSKRQLNKLYQYISRIFEEEAIDAYIKDSKDIGFFETFIIGSDETKKISNETTETMEVIRRADIMEKLSGYVPSSSRRRNEAKQVVQENIDSKKSRLIETLKKKNEIIKYLGRRIVSRDEQLYYLLENLYTRLGKLVEDNAVDDKITT